MTPGCFSEKYCHCNVFLYHFCTAIYIVLFRQTHAIYLEIILSEKKNSNSGNFFFLLYSYIVVGYAYKTNMVWRKLTDMIKGKYLFPSLALLFYFYFRV